MPDQRQAGLHGNSSDFLEVLLLLEKKTMRDLHVATLGEVIEVDSTNELYKCKVIPTLTNEQEKFIQCYCVDELTPDVGDWVLILFLDRNFTQCLRQVRNNITVSKIESQSELHSESYGIIINKVKKSLTVNP